MLIFIVKHSADDKEASRVLSSKSKKTIHGKHLYECRELTSWFRYGEYQIKYDYIAYLFGIEKGLDYHHAKCVKYWDGKELKHVSNIDFITDLIIKRFGNDFDLTKNLLELQELCSDFEGPIFTCMFYKVPFEKLLPYIKQGKENFNLETFLKDNGCNFIENEKED